MKYTVIYYNRYVLDPNDRYTIQRETINAESKQEAGGIIAYCGGEVIGVDEAEAQESARIIEWVGEFPTPAQIEADAQDADWQSQVSELRGGL